MFGRDYSFKDLVTELSHLDPQCSLGLIYSCLDQMGWLSCKELGLQDHLLLFCWPLLPPWTPHPMRDSRWEGGPQGAPRGEAGGVSSVVLQLDDHQPAPHKERTRRMEAGGWAE